MVSVISFPRREVRVIGLITVAHFLSHFYLTALVPFYQAILSEIGGNWTTLSWGIVAYVVCTGVLQTPMGFLVDRVGGRPVLIGGMLILAGGIGSIGFATELWHLIALMAVAGIGNSVFHPADYSIISISVEENRLGKAFSFHSFGGSSGMVSGPLVMAIAINFDVPWRFAINAVGAIGIFVAITLFLLSGIFSEKNSGKRRDAPPPFRELLTSRPLLLMFLFYVCASGANAGIVHFSVPALGQLYSIPVVAAAIALTVYQICSLSCVLPGGFLADSTKRHDLIMIVCLGIAGLMIALIGFDFFPFWMVVGIIGIGGAMRGLVTAARDVNVRHSAGKHSVGTVFAFVSTGFLFGGAVSLPIYGILLDLGTPEIVFWASACFSLLSVGTVVLHKKSRVSAKSKSNN